MNADVLWLLVPIAFAVLIFFATEAGRTIITAFRTAIPGGGFIILVGMGAAFILGVAAYIVVIIGLLIWAMGIMGGLGGRDSGGNGNNWNNGGGE